MEILKEKTEGLCSECYTRVPARVIADGGLVIIEKECPEHGTTRGILERDLAFFKKILSVKRKEDPHPLPFRTLMINITHGCNLKCHLCYLPERDTSLDFTLDEIKETISNYPGLIVALSGGEPTTREDLPEIIRHIRSLGKICSLITNGVRLADYDYVKRLKDAGLTLINFSCNGLQEKAFTGIENARLLETKMRGLHNLKQVGGIFTQLSFTMARGINDDEFGDIIKFALENNDFIYQIRARVATGIGRSLGEKDIYLSDFIRILSCELNIPMGYLMHFWTTTDWFPNVFKCDISFYDFLRDSFIASKLGSSFESQEAYLSHYIGEVNARRILEYKKDPKCPTAHPEFLFILFSWPDKNTMDYEEIKGLNLDILTRDKKILNYWDGVIRNEKLGLI